jgi:hypothetical protein
LKLGQASARPHHRRREVGNVGAFDCWTDEQLV